MASVLTDCDGNEGPVMSRPIRWGVIGLGIGYQHALAIMEAENAQLVAVCDRQSEQREKWLLEFPFVPAFPDEGGMFEEVKLDALVVASYDPEHGPTIERALNQGINVFAEKPLATTFEQYTATANALERNPRARLTTNTLLRRSPRFLALKQMIAAGELGSIFHLEGDYLYGRLEKLSAGWRGEDPTYSVTLGGAVHVVDLVIWLTGERPHRVHALGSGKGLRDSTYSADSSFNGDDFRIALLEFPSGMTAKVSANYACVLPHFHRIDVFGSLGTYIHVPVSSAIAINDSLEGEWSSAFVFQSREATEPPVAIDLPYPATPKGTLIANFNEVLSGSAKLEISEQDAMDVLAVCLAIDASVKSAGPRDIEYRQMPQR